MDECANDNSNECSKSAFCENTIGSYNCICHPGYAGDGRNCSG